ncbi:MAG: branched-chain amino acid transaminase [Methylacidiphilales bacterium]|nr:branched-chain amino acid transaminase [Candidatus Methylacidiphilales bacterium]
MRFDIRDGYIWLDGELVTWKDAKIHILTHSLHYGLAVFEGVRAYKTSSGTAIFRRDDHTNRLFASMKIMGMSCDYSKELINNAQNIVVKQNNLSSAYIRPICFYGAEGMGLKAKDLKTHCAIAAWEWSSYLGEDNMKHGIRLKTSSYRRLSANSSLSKAKVSGNYVNSILASNEVVADGYDEALLLDEKGSVAEGPGENIFMVRDGTLYTPTLEFALEGITRDTIIVIAKQHRIPIVERSISRDELYCADEIFLTGTAAEVVPVRSLDHRVIKNGEVGPITILMQETYRKIVTGVITEKPEWLSYV